MLIKRRQLFGNVNTRMNFKFFFALALLSTTVIPLNQAFAASSTTTINVTNSLVYTGGSIYGSNVRLTITPTVPSTSTAATDTVITVNASQGLIFSPSLSNQTNISVSE